MIDGKRISLLLSSYLGILTVTTSLQRRDTTAICKCQKASSNQRKQTSLKQEADINNFHSSTTPYLIHDDWFRIGG